MRCCVVADASRPHPQAESPDKHVFDVLPIVWPRFLEFCKQAAADPDGVIDGTLKLELGDVGVAAPTVRGEMADITVVYKSSDQGLCTQDGGNYWF